jgi:hypothetical protein
MGTAPAATLSCALGTCPLKRGVGGAGAKTIGGGCLPPPMPYSAAAAASRVPIDAVASFR